MEHDIKDINQAEGGRRRIEWAEREMPVLRTILDQADRLLERILAYRIFEDESGRMNLNLRQAGGQLLLVSQFTLAANTNKGNRPSFTPAAEPAEGKRLFDYLLETARSQLGDVPSGCFGAYMEVRLVNDGPVTLMVET